MLQRFAAGGKAQAWLAQSKAKRIEGIVRVQVKLFATLARLVPDAAPGIPFDVELPTAATVAALVAYLRLPADEVKTVFVNARARPADWVLNQDDEVGIFPPVGGG